MKNVLAAAPAALAALAAAFVPCDAVPAQTNTPIVTPIIIIQSVGELAARAALMQTPFGALPPVTTSTIAGEVQKSPVYSIRYGYVAGANDFSFNNAGATATLPLSIGSTITLGGGVVNCNGCGTGIMAGLGGDVRLHGIPLNAGSDGYRLLIGLAGNLGYGWSDSTALSNGSLFSAAISLPFSFVSASRDPRAWRIVPFVAPGFGFGAAAGIERIRRVGPGGELEIVNESANGTRFVVDGGLAIFRRGSNVALNFGALYLPTKAGSNILAGLGVNYGGW